MFLPDYTLSYHQKNVMLTHVRASFRCDGPYCNTGQWCGSEHVPTVIRDGVQTFL